MTGRVQADQSGNYYATTPSGSRRTFQTLEEAMSYARGEDETGERS